MKKNPQIIKDFFTKKQWDNLEKSDPSISLLAAASWQDPSNFATTAIDVTSPFDYYPTGTDDAKPGDINREELQKKCWVQYKTFGPLNAAIDTKSNYVVGSGFHIYSDILEVDMFLKDLFYSFRNKLYSRCISWMIRMLGEGENFILISLDETGSATLRNLEPINISGGADGTGLFVDPEDITQTIFYRHKGAGEEEFIPDVRFIVDPDYMKERYKLIQNDVPKDKISKLTSGGGKFKNVGGYRRFILHWKNLTGISEYKRDTSSLITTLEWISLYTKALKWELDYKRALSSYTLEIRFSDTPAGKVAWHVWNKMTDTQKDATNLTKPLSPGSRVFIMPGMELKMHAPQLSSLSGSNQDLLNLSGAGARTPQDMWQGQVAGTSYAALRSTRPPLQAEVENLQHIYENFFKYELLRACMKAKIALGGQTEVASKKYKLAESYKVPWVKSIENGKPNIGKIDVEPCEVVHISFPSIRLDEHPEEQANATLGSKHTGIHGIGVSRGRIAKKFGIHDLSYEIRKKAIEDESYGAVESGLEGDIQQGQNTQQGNAKKDPKDTKEKTNEDEDT